MRGADLLVRMLAEQGTEVIFALSGNQIMPIFDACIDAGIRLIHTRHEGAAVFMAEAYAQVTSKPGVALVTAGGGLGNTGGALFSASESDTPVLLLSGDSPAAQDGQGAFQEMDQVAMTAPLTRLSLRPRSAEELARDLSRAIGTAQGAHPGPVHLALPADVLTADAPSAVAKPDPGSVSVAPGLTEETLATLALAQRPLVILGPSLNTTRAPGLSQQLAESLKAPVVALESPRGLGDPSLGRLREVVEQSDLILALGKRVDFTVGFGTGAQDWICVAGDPANLTRARQNLGTRLRLSVEAAPRGFADAMLAQDTGQPDRTGWQDAAATLLAEQPEAPETDADGRITSAGLCAAVQAVIGAFDERVAICDGGEFGQWAQAYLRGHDRIINGPSGAIGGGPAYAIGARAARPDAAIVALMGDGTAGFHLPEFETAAREGLPFVAVIGNDRRWNAEQQIQMRDYGRDRLVGCDLSDARYDLAAEALGAHGEYVTRPQDLQPALDRAFASGKPACVNVEIAGLPAPAPSH